jgi:GNAT superfamily N-acetyltransferase
MRITRWSGEDRPALDGCRAVGRAAHQADEPAGLPMSARELGAFLSGTDGETWITAGDRGVRGWYRLSLPDRENLDLAWLALVVDPGLRRRGAGTMLLRHAAGRATARGRSRLGARNLLQGGAGAAFAAAVGAQAGVAEDRRVLDVTRVAPGCFAGPRDGAARASGGYGLVPWTGQFPRGTLAASPSSARRCMTPPETSKPGAGTRSGSGWRSTAGSLSPVTGLQRGGGPRRDRADGGTDRPVRGPRDTPNGGGRTRPWLPGRTGGIGSGCWSRRRCSAILAP